MSVAFAPPSAETPTHPDASSLERDVARLRQGGHYLRTALDQVSEGVLILMPEQDGRPPYIMHGNARAHLLVCAEPGAGLREKTLDDLAANEAAAAALHGMLQRAQTQGGFAACRCELRTGQRGVPQWFDWRARAVTNEHGVLLNHTLCFHPVEEKPLPEEEDFDAQAERLRVYNLASQAKGIAHDVNNLLGPMMTQLSLTLQRLHGQAELESELRMMFASLKRAKQFTQQVLRCTREPGQGRVPTDMLELVRDTVALCAAGGAVEVGVSAEPGLMWADADPVHMTQVMQNLIMNGIQAMPNGGRLTIELATARLSKGNAEGMPPGAYVEIRVRDRGTGMTEETRGRLFKEAFTTKHDGHGIGLTTCHRYIEEHGGRIMVNSTLNVGTEFRLLLPAVEPQKRAGSGHASGPIPLQHGQGRVLLVDDEAPLRHVARHILKRCGYEVFEAGNGEEAIQVYKDQARAGQAPDVVLMDLSLPGGLTGAEAAREIRAFDPGARLVATSGSVTDELLRVFLDEGFSAVLPKPYEAGALTLKVREVLQTGV